MRRKTAGPHLLSPERTPASAGDDVMDMDIDTDSDYQENLLQTTGAQ